MPAVIAMGRWPFSMPSRPVLVGHGVPEAVVWH